MSKTILLVEDNPSDEKLTLLAFRRSGVGNEIVVARDGVEALELLAGKALADGRRLHELPTLVLLDLKLPRIDGLEVLRRVRADERTRMLPVVILTASRQDEDVLQGYSLGANAYVRKPVDFTRFAEAAQTLGLFWLLLNEAPPEGRSG